MATPDTTATSTAPMTATTAGGAPLSLASVSVRIGGADILTDVSVEFPAGRLTAIIGPNGAGKSTLLAVASGQISPVDGVARLGSDDICRMRVRDLARRRAMMPQSVTVAFPFTVREVVAMGRIAWDPGAADTDGIVAEALDATGLAPFAERIITTLSGGELQRVAFARVVAQAMPVGPGSVILLDEPTSAMDIAHAEATLALAKDLAAGGAAVGVVLHDLDAAAAYADQVVLMDRGRVVAAGDVATVCTAPALSQVYGTSIEVYAHGGRLRIAPARAQGTAAGLP